MRIAVPRRIEPLLWLSPSLALIIGVVAYPALEMVLTSVSDISMAGVNRGLLGFDNYLSLLRAPGLSATLVRTSLWVVFIVGFTTLAALGLALLLNARFPGWRFLRLSLIVPWAASIVVTALSWKWMLNYYYGVINELLIQARLIPAAVDWVGGYDTSFATLVFVSVFLAVPFTSYVLLAGLQTIPADLYEAARVDGASVWLTFRSIQLPLLRPALIVATVLNGIFTFNSFTVIWLMTKGGPGTTTDSTVTFAYKLAFQSRAIGDAAALNVLNLVVLMIASLAYVVIVNRRGGL